MNLKKQCAAEGAENTENNRKDEMKNGDYSEMTNSQKVKERRVCA